MKEVPSIRSFSKLLIKKRQLALTAAALLLAAVSVIVGTTTVPLNLQKQISLAQKEPLRPLQYAVNSKDIPPNVLMLKEDPTPEILEKVLARTKDRFTEEKTMQFREIKKKTDRLLRGQTKILQPGEKGLKEVTKEVMKEDNHIVDSTVKAEVLVKRPEDRIVLTGTKAPEEVAVAVFNHHVDDATSDALKRPVSKLQVTSTYGSRWGRFHRGIDLAMPTGSSILAADDGVVSFSGYKGSYGKLVQVDHENGMMTYYAHCSALLTEAGERVARGDTIAKVGSTGNSTGPHLHFEVLCNGENVNPMNYLSHD